LIRDDQFRQMVGRNTHGGEKARHPNLQPSRRR
jgi:hypothetical protein